MMDVELPVFYVVSRNLPGEMAAPVLAALSITPIGLAIISNILDARLAFQLTQSVVRVVTDEEALAMAFEIGQEEPVLVIGEADVLDAYYPDGRKELVSTC